jgi:glycerol-3-phosphate acyltransferase PlsY
MPLALVSLLIGYLLGSIPSAALAARFKGRRISEIGSGNMGAMNAARNLGWALGAAVFAVDVGKGALASYVGLLLHHGLIGVPELMTLFAAGVGAVLGHAWPVYTGFKGGKGLATTLGVSLPLYPLGGLAGLALLILLVLLLRRVTQASVLTVALYPPLAYLIEALHGHSGAWLLALAVSLVLIAFIIIVKHLPALQESRGVR